MAQISSSSVQVDLTLNFNDKNYFKATINEENILKTEYLQFYMDVKLSASDVVDYGSSDV
jgi:hypothetical protein